jgi:hypothetical protein
MSATQHVGDSFQIDQPQVLGLGHGATKLVKWQDRGQVEQGPRDGRDREAAVDRLLDQTRVVNGNRL